MLLILKALYFFLPAYFANMAPVIFKKVPFLAKPVNAKLFGVNKTWRGLVLATLTGTLIFLLQKQLYQLGGFWENIALIDYTGFSILLGALLAFGAILGDLVESYFKRKRGTAPGKQWFPWDQLDFVIGAFLLSFVIYVPAIEVIVMLLLLTPLLHVGTNHIAYYLKIRKEKF